MNRCKDPNNILSEQSPQGLRPPHANLIFLNDASQDRVRRRLPALGFPLRGDIDQHLPISLFLSHIHNLLFLGLSRAHVPSSIESFAVALCLRTATGVEL
jgi:hypothetical protein